MMQREGVTNFGKGSTVFELGCGRCIEICPDEDKEYDSQSRGMSVAEKKQSFCINQVMDK